MILHLFHRPAKRSKRERRILLAVWGTVGGILLVTTFVLWVELRRDTDLADPSAGITKGFRGAGNVSAPPIRFVDVAAELGVAMRHGPGPRGRMLPEDTGSGVAWGDVDGDGDDDLYLVNFPGPLDDDSADAINSGAEGRGRDRVVHSTGSNRLFRNDGRRFTDVTESAGVGDIAGFGMGASFADYDDDGHLDLYVTNFGPNRLYRNRGNGTFEEVAAQAGVADALWSTGAAWGDYNRDGHLDLYVCNYVDYETGGLGSDLTLETSAGEYGVPFTLNPNSFDPQPNRLYQNRGNGTFTDVSEECGVRNPRGRSLAATFCDLDGDGWLDLYVNNDVSTNRLFRNLGARSRGGGAVTFVDLASITGTADPRGSMGLSVGEVGGMTGSPDGLPDLFVTHWVAQENALYQSLRFMEGQVEYRDKTRDFRLGEVSIETVGWGSAMVDLDLDGSIDIAVVNGSTLEEKSDPHRLVREPIFLFWNSGRQFQDVAPAAGDVVGQRHGARGLAAADFDADGDIDLAVGINRGQPLILRNETPTANRSLTVRLRGRAAVCFGARVEVVVGDRRQFRWFGGDVTYLGMHSADLIFGLGESAAADAVRVRWADGTESSLNDVSAGRIEVTHPRARSTRE